jgi:glycosyltransferase involved in cell wall biosynthesis
MQDNSNVQFLVVGEGGLKETFQRECADLANVTFAPGVPKSMVHSVLERCDLLYFSVRPSKIWKFGQSLNKVTDYMLAGRPVVASYSGYPSMVNEAGSGTYVPAGDAAALRVEIERYAAMPETERQAIGMVGRKWLIANRSYAKLGRDYLDLCLGLDTGKRTNPLSAPDVVGT